MAEFLLKGTKYEVEEMSFEAVERAWPYITLATLNEDPIAGVAAGIAVIAAAVVEQDWFKPETFGIDVPEDLFVNKADYIFDQLRMKMKRMLKSSEIGAVRLCVIEMTKEAGLMPEPGEGILPGPPVTMSPGTETLIESLPS